MKTAPAKTLAVAVDFNDNIAGHEPSPKRMYTPAEVERMIDYFYGLGVRRLYWFHNAHSGLYASSFGGASNLLSFAAQAAHDRDMSILSVIKPFETGTVVTFPPHLEPPPIHTQTVQGFHVFASPFAKEHPEMRLIFRPRNGVRPVKGGVRRVELINQNYSGTSLQHDDLELCWSPINGQFRCYQGPMRCDTRIVDNAGAKRRVLSWNDLAIPPEARFILVRYLHDTGKGDFVNKPEELLRLSDEDGPLVSQSDRGLQNPKPEVFLTWGLELPEATRAVLEDPEQCKAAFKDFFHFDNNARPLPLRVINEPGGFICHSLNFNEYCPGALHPAYPEVRQNWLDRVALSLETGVDGLALRISNHSSWCGRPKDLGFNDPALREYTRRTGSKSDAATVDFEFMRIVNGDFYTQFLREARKMTKQQGRKLEHFISPLMDRLQPNLLNNVPEAFQFDYRQWMREGLLDGLCLRPFGAPSFEVQRWFADTVAAQARFFNLPIYFTNVNGLLNRACVDQSYHEVIDSELKRVGASDMYDGFILYEAAGIMGIDEQGGWHSCAPLERAIRKWWPSATSSSSSGRHT